MLLLLMILVLLWLLSMMVVGLLLLRVIGGVHGSSSASASASGCGNGVLRGHERVGEFCFGWIFSIYNIIGATLVICDKIWLLMQCWGRC